MRGVGRGGRAACTDCAPAILCAPAHIAAAVLLGPYMGDGQAADAETLRVLAHQRPRGTSATDQCDACRVRGHPGNAAGLGGGVSDRADPRGGARRAGTPDVYPPGVPRGGAGPWAVLGVRA